MQRHGERGRAADLGEPRPILLHFAINGEIVAHILENVGSVLIHRLDHAIVHPLSLPSGRHNSRPAQVSEMPRDLGLRHLQDFDEETHADLVIPHQIEYPQAIAVGKRDEEFFEIESSDNSTHDLGIIS